MGDTAKIGTKCRGMTAARDLPFDKRRTPVDVGVDGGF